MKGVEEGRKNGGIRGWRVSGKGGILEVET